MNTTKNLLDTDVPEINTPLLKPTKYVPKSSLRENWIQKSKQKANNLFDKSKEEVLNLFDKYRNNVNKGTEKITNWYNHLKENVLNIFNKIQEKPQMVEPKFKLDREALNVTKRYEMDLEKSGLSLYDPLSLLGKIKLLVMKKFKKYPSTKQQLTLVCLMKKTNPVTGEETIDKAHFHSYYEEIFEGSNFDEIYEKMKDKIIKSFEEYLRNSSLWKFHKSLKIILNINKIK